MASVVPLWAGRYLPFTDLPQHVAAIATLRHWWDPAWKAQEYFTLDAGRSQYLLYYLVGTLLAFPLDTAERANLVLLSLTALAFPYALRSLLRALRADERLALFAPALFYSQALLIGFFNYVAALPLLMWALGLAVRDAEQPAPRRTAVLALAAVGLFYLHLSAFLLFAPAAALASAMLSPRSPRAIARRLVWAGPAAAMSVAFVAISPVVHPHEVGWDRAVRIFFEPPGEALRKLPRALLDIWPGPGDELVLCALVAAAALIAWPQRRDPEPEDQPQRRRIAAAWLAMAALLYLAFPIRIGWLWQLNERYAIAFALLAPCVLRPVRGWRGDAPLLLAAGAGLFSAGLAVPHVRAFSAEVDGFDRVLDITRPGERLRSLVYDPGSAHARFSPYLHFGSYYRARKGGVAAFSFAELPQSPLRYRPESAPPAMPEGWEWDPRRFSNEREGPYYDYLLVRGSVDPLARHPAGPSWRRIAHEGLWSLYAKEGEEWPDQRVSPARDVMP